jgi:hypothetical protein
LSIALLFDEEEKMTPDTFSLSANAHELPGCSKGSSIFYVESCSNCGATKESFARVA